MVKPIHKKRNKAVMSVLSKSPQCIPMISMKLPDWSEGGIAKSLDHLVRTGQVKMNFEQEFYL